MMKKGQESELMHELNRLVEYARHNATERHRRLLTPSGVKFKKLKAAVSKSIPFLSDRSLALWIDMFLKSSPATDICIGLYWWARGRLYLLPENPEDFDVLSNFLTHRLSETYLRVVQQLEGVPLKLHDEFLNNLPDAVSRVAYKVLKSTTTGPRKAHVKKVGTDLIRMSSNWINGVMPESRDWKTWRQARLHPDINASSLTYLEDDGWSDASGDEKCSCDELSDDEAASDGYCPDDQPDLGFFETPLPKVASTVKTRYLYSLGHSPFVTEYLKASNIRTNPNLNLSLRLTEKGDKNLKDSMGFQRQSVLNQRKHRLTPKLRRDELDAVYNRRSLVASKSAPVLPMKGRRKSVKDHNKHKANGMVTEFDIENPVLKAREMRRQRDAIVEGQVPSQERVHPIERHPKVLQLEHKLDALVITSKKGKTRRRTNTKMRSYG